MISILAKPHPRLNGIYKKVRREIHWRRFRALIWQLTTMYIGI